MKPFIWLVGLAAFTVACGTTPSANSDSGSGEDAGATDSGTEVDAGNDGGANVDGGNDAGTQDAGSADSGSDGGCPYLYCEDFEGYDAGAVANGELLGPWKATVNGLGIQVRVDTVNPRSGRQSFHVTAQPDAGTARGTLNQTHNGGLVPGNDMYGRMELFYSDAGTYGLPLAVHSWVFNSSGLQSDGGSSNMNMGGGGTKLQLNYHPPVGNEQSVQGGVMTPGVWHCVQWQYNGSGTPPSDTANVWIDGTLAVPVPVTKGWTFPTPWNSFDFGFNHYQVLPNAVDVFVDDFALDSAMVPCPP
jgi:hypothetical protein